jgi:hypothetical protein
MNLKIAVVALAAFGGVALTSNAASAMPNGIPQANQIAGQTSNVEQAHYGCNGWGRCGWRPGWRSAYGYYRPHPYGWHRWHHWHHY